MDLIESAVKALRYLRSLMPAKERHERRPAFALCQTDEVAEIINCHELEIRTLANVSSLSVSSSVDDAPIGSTVSVVNENLSIYLNVEGTINAEAEREKLRKKMEEICKQQETLSRTMNASGYKEKVPPHIHEENVAKLASLMQELVSFEKASQHLEREVAAQ
ncbi:hypothetical protein Droror1_Dr00019916 [Drosera rotundifolia]